MKMIEFASPENVPIHFKRVLTWHILVVSRFCNCLTDLEMQSSYHLHMKILLELSGVEHITNHWPW